MKESVKNKLIITKDGAPTLESGRFGVTYHSIHGAIQESNHVFIDAGLRHMIKEGREKVCIFEMGFGTGLNAWLTCKFAVEHGLLIDYHSVELFPLSQDEIELYSNSLTVERDELFSGIHRAEWGASTQVDEGLNLHKYQESLLEMELPAGIDLVYFDAFAPTAQPELWTLDVFEKLFTAMNNGAILVTYCCKGDVRRAMLAAGFGVEKIPGPPGKREMIRATKPLS